MVEQRDRRRAVEGRENEEVENQKQNRKNKQK